MVSISSIALTAPMRLATSAAQASLSTATTELSSGTYADLGLGIGGRSGQVISLAQEQARLNGFSAGNTAATTRLSATASALSSLQTVASSFLSTLTSASTTGGITASLQGAAAGNLSSLISTLNTSVGGQALFGGINSAGTPMAAYADGSASKQAVDDAFQGTFGTSQDSADASSITADQMTSFLNGSFADLFSASGYEGTWSSASDTTISTQIAPSETVSTSVSANNAAFRGLAQAYTMVSELTGSNMDSTTQQAVVQSAISVLSGALSSLTQVQAGVGLSQNAITDATSRITAQTSLISSQNDDLTSVDPVELNTRITNLQTQIEASYRLTSQLQQLSLVNYLSG